LRTFGETVRQLREERNMTGEELGKVFHMSKSAISNWENGKRFPDEPTLNTVANYFGVSLDYLLGRTDIRNMAIKKDVVNGKNVEVGYDTREYPDGLSHDQVIEILESMKKAGIKFEPKP
jgi:transcriptional regulator with XRE-family HTH domain